MFEEFWCSSSLLPDSTRTPLDKASSFAKGEVWPNLRTERPKLLHISCWPCLSREPILSFTKVKEVLWIYNNIIKTAFEPRTPVKGAIR